MRIAVIGAGISGVSLGFYLSEYKKNGKDIEIDIFEKSDGPGGCIRSARADGYLVESGPNGVLNSKAHFRELYQSAGLDDILKYSSNLTSKRYIQLNHKAHPAPQGLISALTTPLLSMKGKLRILKEPFVAAKNDDKDESVYDFAKRRIGAEAAENLISTLIGGIYAGDAKKLSIKSAFPRLYNLEKDYGGLIKGMIGKMKAAKNDPDRPKKKKSTYTSSTLISSTEGMHGLVTHLADRCDGVHFHYNTDITRLEKKDGKYLLTSPTAVFEADIVISCCNAHDSVRLFNDIDKELTEAFAKVEFAPIFICGMGFDRQDVKHPLDGFGYLAAPKDCTMVLGTLFSSSLFEGRAPEGKVLVTSITVGDRNRQMIYEDEETLKKTVFAQVKDILGFTNEPETVLTFKYERAIPQYYLGHSEIIDTINRRAEALGNLYIGSNTSGGVSVADCVLTSKTIAEQIVNKL